VALLDTFAKLKAMVLAQTESVATDFTVQAGISISELIFMGHQRIGREVRCRQMEGTLSASSTITGGVVALPADYVDLKYARLSNEQPTRPLIKRTASFIYERYPFRQASSRPMYCAREFSNLIFGPYPDDGQKYIVAGVYWKRLGGLSATTTGSGTISNAVFTAHPDLYLAASVAEAIPFLGFDKRIAVWEGKYANIKDALMNEVNTEAYEGSEVSFDG
jgi:hypothetical protein